MNRESPEPSGYLGERVRRALAADPRVAELGIAVSVVGGRVFLSGTVPTPQRQQAISAVVAEILPGYDIHNDVSVTPVAPDSQTEMLA